MKVFKIKKEESIELNNADAVIKKFETEEFPSEIPYMRMTNSGSSEPVITAENIKHNSEFIVNLFDDIKVVDESKKMAVSEQLDPIDKIIRLIRNAKTEEEARKLFEQYFDLLMSCDVVQAWIARDRREGPIDDYYLSKHDEMLDEASKVLLKAFENGIKQQTELEQIKNISDFLNLKFAFHDLKKIKKDSVNAFEISNNLIYLYPLNNGRPTCSFEFYKNGELVISNDKEYSQLSNLDDIILQMVRIFSQSLDNKIVLDPYYFMLELTDEICKGYNGRAKLIITEKAIRNQKLNEENFDEANKYFINRFLDHFIGWNFGLSVNRNEVLKRELEELNEKVIDMGIREYAGSGFEVYGATDKVCDGLQHYKLPVEKTKKLIQKRSIYNNKCF